MYVFWGVMCVRECVYFPAVFIPLLGVSHEAHNRLKIECNSCYFSERTELGKNIILIFLKSPTLHFLPALYIFVYLSVFQSPRKPNNPIGCGFEVSQLKFQ